MKKLICILVVAMLIPSVSMAIPFTDIMINRLDSITDEEIFELYSGIIEQFDKRNLSPYSSAEGVAVPAGRYTIGEDIPVGVYRLEFPNDMYDSGRILIFKNGEEIPDNIYFVGAGENVPVYGKLELSDGMIFELQDTTATFFVYSGLFGK